MEEFEMPTPCQKCGKWFDLNDGLGSTKWYPNTLICEDCGHQEREELERDEEIEDLKTQIEDAEYTIKEARARLVELGVSVPTKINTPNY